MPPIIKSTLHKLTNNYSTVCNMDAIWRALNSIYDLRKICSHFFDDVSLFLAWSINNNSYNWWFNVKNLNIPFLTSNLTFICRSRSSGHKVIICTLRVAFQIAKPEVDSSSNSRDITIYVLTSLTSVSRSRDKNVKVSVYHLKELG